MSEGYDAAMMLRTIDIDASWENTGGGVMCVVIEVGRRTYTIGTASGFWGWSLENAEGDHTGDDFDFGGPLPEGETPPLQLAFAIRELLLSTGGIG